MTISEPAATIAPARLAQLYPLKRYDLPVAGAYFEGRYPFVRSSFTAYDDGGPYEQPCWKPGTRAEYYCPDDTEMVADAEGAIILTVVSVHKPGKYPTRVFFTRRWRDPQRREFGKGSLRCATVAQFYKLARGYRHEFRVVPQDCPAREVLPS